MGLNFIRPICVLCLIFLSKQVYAQVVYERTFPNELPSIQIPIELSDTSTFSLGDDINYSTNCGGIKSRHIDINGIELRGNILYRVAFSYGYHWLGHDSVLIWLVRPSYNLDHEPFEVWIWTPQEITKILSTGKRFETRTYRNGAFLYNPDRLVYQRSDILYTKDLLTSIVEDSLIITGISHIREFGNSILVFSEFQEPLVLNEHLEVIYEWQYLSSLPFNIDHSVVLDSFLVGKEEMSPASLVRVNVYDESQVILDLSPYFDQIEDVQANKNRLLVKGMANGESFVLQLDDKFEVVGLTTLDLPVLNEEMTFHYYPDRVYAWCSDGLANYNANYRMSYKYAEAGPIQFLDIALDTMWVDSVYKHNDPWHYPAEVYVSAVIRNLSSEPLQTFTIHYEQSPFDLCDPVVHPYHFEGLNVTSGEDDTVSFQIWSYDVAHGIPFIRRFYAQHANHHLDQDITNNDFELKYLTTSTGEPVSASILVYPNPFTDILLAADYPGLLKLELYDQLGHIVSIGYNRLDHLGKLPAGLYYLRITTDTAMYLKQLIKVE